MKEAQKEKRKKSRIRRTQFKESSNIPSLSPPDQGISFSFIGSVRILGKGGVARPLLRMRKDYPKEMYRSINELKDDERLSKRIFSKNQCIILILSQDYQKQY